MLRRWLNFKDPGFIFCQIFASAIPSGFNMREIREFWLCGCRILLPSLSCMLYFGIIWSGFNKHNSGVQTAESLINSLSETTLT